MKKKLSLLLAAVLTLSMGLAGCGSSTETTTAETTAAETTAAAAEEETTAAETTAAETEPEKTESDTAILVVSFGTSFNDSRDITIGAVEQAIADAHPEYEVRRAFTAQIIIDKLKDRDGLEIDNVTQALDRAVADGVKKLIVQPTHLMNGLEYNDVMDEISAYAADFESISVGQPLLTSNEDYAGVIAAITEATKSYDDGKTAIVYMGHGTEAVSNEVYTIMQNKLAESGYENYYIGTVEAAPTLEDVIAALKEHGGYEKVVLAPLMLVAGDHANNDMAGDEEDSWKTALANEGYEVECLIQGLGELPGVQKLYVEHVDSAIEKLDQSKDTAILAVSFGTSFNDSRDITIGAIENTLADAFPEYPVRRAFTAQIIIDKLAERDGIEIDNVTQALDRAVADGIKTLIIQPTHLMNGLEYADLAAEVEKYQSDFEQIVIGAPLLTDDADYDAAIAALEADSKAYDDGETAIVYMGHGTEAESNQVYSTMQEKLTAAGLENYYIGTVEAAPTMDDVIAALEAKGTYKKVVLAPLMVVAGDHANNDMAGDEEDSWKTALEDAGYEVTSRLNGLGENAAIRDIYVKHAQAAIDSLK